MTEGLACGFETTNPNAAFGPGSAVQLRDEALRDLITSGTLLPLAEFVALEEVSEGGTEEEEAERARMMYTQAYSFFSWSFRHEREALAAYFSDIVHEPMGQGRPARHAQMFARRFGNPARVERAWIRDERHRLGL